MGFDYRFKVYWRNKGFRKVLSLLPPRSLNQGINYVNSIVETNLASRMAAGSIRAYQQASNLSYVPTSLIGVAISTAVFPKMAERLGQGRPDLFKKELQATLRVIIWLALPVTIVAFFGRGYLVNFIKNGGDVLMSGILGILAISILFSSVFQIAARTFYAQQDTKTPLYISFVAIALNIILAVWFTLGLGMGVYGLAWAAAIVSIVQVIILLVMMSKRIKSLFDSTFMHAVARMTGATGVMAVITYICFMLLPLRATDHSFFSSFPRFSLIVLISLVSYLAASWLFKLQEVNPIISRAKSVLFGGLGRI
jgi:putative peptidoglycan lipid II flippase